DVLVDLVGYRRFGHNEGDEPAYTQPLMYEKIAHHPPVRVQYAQELESRGIVTAREAEEWVAAAQKALHDAHEALRASLGAGTRVRPKGSNGSTGPSGDASTFDTAVPAERLDE